MSAFLFEVQRPALGLWIAFVMAFASVQTVRGSDVPAVGDRGSAPAQGESENHASPAAGVDALTSTNLVKQHSRKSSTAAVDYKHQIDVARQLRRNKDNPAAEKMLVDLLENEMPPEFKRGALFELALVAQDSGRLSRAQQILAQYIQLFPQDPTVPEVLLRQGLIFRQLGAANMAIAKYYAVMNTALGLKLDQFDYYKRLVLQAQTEIADTYYLQAKFTEAADFFNRILKQDTAELNRAQIHFKLIRCLSSLGRHSEVVVQAQSFFEKNSDAPEVPELRFVCASSFKQLGRVQEALDQVLKLLKSQENTAQSNPENWAYWQQRAGNDIANHLYLEGDFLNALEIYNYLADLSKSAAWQLPVWYQLGLIYERLHQPEKAKERYAAIAAREKEVAESGDAPNLKTVIEMAKWRRDQIHWHNRTELAVQSLLLTPAPDPTTNTAPSKRP